MKIRNKRTGVIAEIGMLSMIAGMLRGKIKVGKAPGFSQTIRGGQKIPRNETCPFCDSGTKFKHCHGATPEQKNRRAAARQYHEHGSDYIPFN